MIRAYLANELDSLGGRLANSYSPRASLTHSLLLLLAILVQVAALVQLSLLSSSICGWFLGVDLHSVGLLVEGRVGVGVVGDCDLLAVDVLVEHAGVVRLAQLLLVYYLLPLLLSKGLLLLLVVVSLRRHVV